MLILEEILPNLYPSCNAGFLMQCSEVAFCKWIYAFSEFIRLFALVRSTFSKAQNRFGKMIEPQNHFPKKQQRRSIVAREQQCFSVTGAQDRIENRTEFWKKALPMAGTEESWLAVLPNGNFQCKCCFFRQSQLEQMDRRKIQGLASTEGLQPTPWTRLQTFRQHANRQHELNVALYVRTTMPEVPATDFASPAHDFLDLYRSVKQRKVKSEESFGKRKKIRAMTYCLAEACRRRKHRLFHRQGKQH